MTDTLPEKPAAPPRHSCQSGSPIWVLDAPEIYDERSEWIDISGWIASTRMLDRMIMDPVGSAAGAKLEFTSRPDVETAFGIPAMGFRARCERSLLGDAGFLTLAFERSQERFEIVVPVPRGGGPLEHRKRRKLERIRPYLRCPVCRSSLAETGNPAELACERCGSAFGQAAGHFDFLTPDLREQYNIVETENISTNQYDGTALNYIRRNPDGLILDCGAGLRDKYFENVVNFEIVPYPTSDVLGVGEHLPFADGAFDCVFSFAVLEHVKNPFGCAQELLRVLKPGGALYCQVPFLVPLHGYPHHYYNMSRQGLDNLFPSDMIREGDGTMNFGQPIFTLSWFLNSYCAGLPDAVAERFRELRVKDLLDPGGKYLGREFVTGLSDRAQDELACCNYLILRKPPN